MGSIGTNVNASRIALAVEARTDVGRVRTNNEDAFGVADISRDEEVECDAAIDVGPHGALLVVSDGMGGAAFGEVAARLSIAALRNSLAARLPRLSPEQAMRESVEVANTAVFDAARAPGRKGMGATLVAVLVHGEHAYFTEVGDSRSYVVRAGQMAQVSRDQSYAQVLLDSGALRREDVDAFPMKHVIVQAMGARSTVDVPLRRLALKRGDRLLLCSDGLSGRVSDDVMAAILRDVPLREAAHELVGAANAAGGDDNITVVLAEVSGDAVRPPGPRESVASMIETLHAFAARELP
jgi:serine/threonine protein phosphatase PrpC